MIVHTVHTPGYRGLAEQLRQSIPRGMTLMLHDLPGEDASDRYTEGWARVMAMKVATWQRVLRGEDPILVCDADCVIRVGHDLPFNLAVALAHHDVAFQWLPNRCCPGVMALKPNDRTRELLRRLQRGLESGESYSEQQMLRNVLVNSPVLWTRLPPELCSTTPTGAIQHAAGVDTHRKIKALTTPTVA